jgi:hypothetical protein
MIFKIEIPEVLIAPFLGLLKQEGPASLVKKFGWSSVIDASKIKNSFFDLLQEKVIDYQI